MACHVALNSSQKTYEQILARQQSDINMLVPVREQYQVIQKIKERLVEKQRIHENLMKRDLPWPQVLWAIGRILPAGVGLTHLSAARGEEKSDYIWKLKIAVNRLRDFPESGRVVPEIAKPEIREIVRGNYRLIYRCREDRVEILTAFHGARLLNEEDLSSKEDAVREPPGP